MPYTRNRNMFPCEEEIRDRFDTRSNTLSKQGNYWTFICSHKIK